MLNIKEFIEKEWQVGNKNGWALWSSLHIWSKEDGEKEFLSELIDLIDKYYKYQTQ